LGQDEFWWICRITAEQEDVRVRSIQQCGEDGGDRAGAVVAKDALLLHAAGDLQAGLV
jgi:hypothetical protein